MNNILTRRKGVLVGMLPPPGPGDLSVSVFIHNELCGLAGGVDHQRVPVEPLDHDGILCTQVVGREGVGLPLETLVRIGEILCVCECECVCVCVCVSVCILYIYVHV